MRLALVALVVLPLSAQADDFDGDTAFLEETGVCDIRGNWSATGPHARTAECVESDGTLWNLTEVEAADGTLSYTRERVIPRRTVIIAPQLFNTP